MQLEDRYADLLPRGIKVEENYLCYRSFCRGAEVTALNKGLSKTVVEFVHRWSKFEQNKGKIPGFNMLEHYVLKIAKSRIMRLREQAMNFLQKARPENREMRARAIF